MNTLVAIAPPPLTSLVRRICSEYLEMPGLSLTAAQAQRLFALDGTLCADALQFLVDAHFLRRTERGEYVRLTEGVFKASAGGEPVIGDHLAQRGWAKAQHP